MVTLMRFNIFLIFFFIFAYILHQLPLFSTLRNKSLYKFYINLSIYLSFLFIAAITLFPISSNVESYKPVINFIPFKTIIMFLKSKNIIDILFNIIGNFILFIPLGYFISIKLKWNLKKSFIICLCTTLFVESVQLILVGRTTDIDDIIINSFGGYIGILLSSKCKINSSF